MGRAVGEKQAPFLLPASEYSLTNLIRKSIQHHPLFFMQYLDLKFVHKAGFAIECSPIIFCGTKNT